MWRAAFFCSCCGVRTLLVLLVAASCSSPAPTPTIENRKPVTPDKPPSPTEMGATLWFDDAPGGKKFQGVWLGLGGDRNYVIDYRPRSLWLGFVGHELLVTGHCYQPFGQAISAQHFRVERLRFATKPTTSVPLFEIGPEIVMKGSFVDHPYPAGSKLAGSSQLKFHHADGTAYGLAGGDDEMKPGPAQIKARVVEVNMAHHAQTGGPKIWVAYVMHGDEPDRDTPMPCP
jgi:hypothetical protein